MIAPSIGLIPIAGVATRGGNDATDVKRSSRQSGANANVARDIRKISATLIPETAGNVDGSASKSLPSGSKGAVVFVSMQSWIENQFSIHWR